MKLVLLFLLVLSAITSAENAECSDNKPVKRGDGCFSRDILDMLFENKKYIENLRDENKDMKATILRLGNRLDAMDTKLAGVTKQLQSLQNSKGTAVAFFAWLTNENTAGTAKVPIKYDNVVTNVGNGYQSSSGNFIAPVKGVYMFAVTLMDKKGPAHVDIMQNGKEVCAVRSSSGGNLDNGSNVIVLSLEKSDKVFVRNHINSGLHSHAGRYAFNTFSGFLIQSM